MTDRTLISRGGVLSQMPSGATSGAPPAAFQMPPSYGPGRGLPPSAPALQPPMVLFELVAVAIRIL